MRHVKLRPGMPTNTAALSRLIETAYEDIKARVVKREADREMAQFNKKRA